MIRRRVYVLISRVYARRWWLQTQYARGRTLSAAFRRGRWLVTAENGKTKIIEDVSFYVYHINLSLLGHGAFFIFVIIWDFFLFSNYLGHFFIFQLSGPFFRKPLFTTHFSLTTTHPLKNTLHTSLAWLNINWQKNIKKCKLSREIVKTVKFWHVFKCVLLFPVF